MNSAKTDLKMQVKVRGEGTSLLLVPGGLTGWKSWEPFMDDFADRQKKVISVQLLNVQFGLEGRDLPPGYSVRMESDALESTLDSLDIHRPLDIIGWSYGGLIALDYALNRPERVRSLVLIEPPAFWVIREEGSVDAETKRHMDYFESMHGEISEKMLADFADRAGLIPPGQNARELPFWEDWMVHRQSLRNCPAIMAHRDKLERLQGLQAPVLLIKGTGSSNYYHQIIDLLSGKIPVARAIELHGMHAPHIVSRDMFIRDLDSFHRNSIH